jgi:hypothetical protein
MSDSDGADDVAGQQAMVANMLGPLNAKLKKAQKRLDKLEGCIESLRKVGEESLPAARKELQAGTTDLSLKLERAQVELAQCASKTTLEVVRQEQTAMEQRLRSVIDEQRGKIAAQELMMQGLESRMASMESSSRVNEVKTSGELSALASQLSQLNASLERQRGESEARLSEVSSRVLSSLDGVAGRVAAVEDEQQRVTSGLARKADLAEANASTTLRFESCAAQVEVVQGQVWHTSCHLHPHHVPMSRPHSRVVQLQVRKAIEAVAALESHTATLASLQALEELHTKTDAIASEARQLITKATAASAADRTSFEDGLAQRFLRFEAIAQEARQDWHRLAAQLEQLQTYVTERALRAEHDQLAEAVSSLREASASKEELQRVEDLATAAAAKDAFAELAADMRALQVRGYPSRRLDCASLPNGACAEPQAPATGMQVCVPVLA